MNAAATTTSKRKLAGPIRKTKRNSATAKVLRQKVSPSANITVENDTGKQTKEYRCIICSEAFDDSRALGGHFSKAHKGMSAAYNKKMEVRNARTSHRDALFLAKELLKRHGTAKDIKLVKRFYLT